MPARAQQLIAGFLVALLLYVAIMVTLVYLRPPDARTSAAFVGALGQKEAELILLREMVIRLQGRVRDLEAKKGP
jgi:hypothetical protein